MQHLINLDERLSLAYNLYDTCGLAADIGTDHAHLPAALLQRGRCQHMILTDLSEKALRNARNEMIRLRLTDRVSMRVGNGLTPVNEACSVISIMGMGGQTISDILLGGQEKLRNASLILSAHTDIPLIREAVRLIGYHLDCEEPCFCAGRYYLVLRARPGEREISQREIRLGSQLFYSSSALVAPYLMRCRDILMNKLRGLTSSAAPDSALIAQLRGDIAYYNEKISERKKTRDHTECV